MSFTGKGLKCELNPFGLLYQCRSSLSLITHFDRTNRTDGITARLKSDRHGKAKVLSYEEIQLLFTHGLKKLRDRTIFATPLFTAARINEVVTLLSDDIYDKEGRVRSHHICYCPVHCREN